MFAGNDNIRDTWAPFGSGDMLERAMLIAWRSDFRRDEDLLLAFDLVSSAGALVLGAETYGLTVGAAADLCVVEASCVPEAVASFPPRKLVMRAGRIVARDGKVLEIPEDPTRGPNST